MKRFFNIIPGKDAACILLYGEIGEYDRVRSGDIARELIEAESASRQIDVRINSIGGDIFTGMAIFNAFRQSAADITLYRWCGGFYGKRDCSLRETSEDEPLRTPNGAQPFGRCLWKRGRNGGDCRDAEKP